MRLGRYCTDVRRMLSRWLYLPTRKHKPVCGIMLARASSQLTQGRNRNAVQTVTVYITTTQYQQTQGITTVIAAGGQGQTTRTTTQGGVVAVVGTTTAGVTYNGYCTTIFAKGENLPTTAAAPCGVALVVNGAVRPVAWQVLGMVAGFWCLLFANFGPSGIHRLS
jgi:hypothetical protein